MSRIVARVAFPVALGLLAASSVTFARAAVVAYGDVANGQFVPSAAPALLGPIDELGRNGWRCIPERAAAAASPADAELPTGDER